MADERNDFYVEKKVADEAADEALSSYPNERVLFGREDMRNIAIKASITALRGVVADVLLPDDQIDREQQVEDSSGLGYASAEIAAAARRPIDKLGSKVL